MNRNATWSAEKGGLLDRSGRQMNRNAAWPAEKGRTTSDRPGRQVNRNVANG